MAEIWAFPNGCLVTNLPATPGGPLVPGMIVTGHFCVTGAIVGWVHYPFYSDFIPEGTNPNQIQTRIVNGVVRAAEEESPGRNGEPGWFTRQPGDKVIIVGGISSVTI